MENDADSGVDDVKQSVEIQQDEHSAIQPIFTPRLGANQQINQSKRPSIEPSQSFFDLLPEDLITSVFDYLSTLSLLRLTVSKSFSRLSQRYSSFDVDLDREITDGALVARSLQQSKDQYAPVIAAAGRFSHLNSLVLNSFGSLLTDSQIQPLLDRHADSLMNVSLAGNNLTCPVIRAHHLLTLDLSKNRRLTNPTFACPSLIELDLSRTFINDFDFLHCFSCAPRLRVLRLRACKNITLLPLSLPHVQIVDLSFTAVLDDAVARLTQGSPYLSVLFLNECNQLRSPSIHSESITVLSCKLCELLRAPSLDCPALTELDFSQTNITDQALAHAVSRSSRLQVLGLRHCHGLDAPQLINELPSLTSVDMYTSSISTRGCIGFLENCPRLRALQLTLCEGLMPPFIEQEHDIYQRRWTTLEQIGIQSTHLDDADLRSLVVMAPNLSQIQAANCHNITGTGLSSISLTHIDLGACEVTDAILINLFANCPSLLSASFNHCTLLHNPVIIHEHLEVLHLDFARSMDSVTLRCSRLLALHVEANLNLTTVTFDGVHDALREVFAKHVNQLVLNSISDQLSGLSVEIHGNAASTLELEELAYKPSRTAPQFRSAVVSIRRPPESHSRTTTLGTSPSSSHLVAVQNGSSQIIRSSPRTTSRRLSNSHSREGSEPAASSPSTSPANAHSVASTNHQRHLSSTTVSPSSSGSLLRRSRISNTLIHPADHSEPNSPNLPHAGPRSHTNNQSSTPTMQPALPRSRSASNLLSLPGSPNARHAHVAPRPSTANAEAGRHTLTALLQARRMERVAHAADVMLVSNDADDVKSKSTGGTLRLERAASLSEVDKLPRFCLNSIEIYIIQSHITDIEEKLCEHHRALAAKRARNGHPPSQLVESLVLSQAMHYGLKRQLAMLKAKLKKELKAIEAESAESAESTAH